VFFVPQLYYRCFRRIRTKEYYRREIKYKLELFGKFTGEIRKIRKKMQTGFQFRRKYDVEAIACNKSCCGRACKLPTCKEKVKLYTHRANSREAYQESKKAAKRQGFS
jgi:hypothetical protein